MGLTDFIAPEPGTTLGNAPKQTSLSGLSQLTAQKQPQLTVGAEPVNDPVFELAFGFLPTLNLGTALGIENSTLRFVANVALDPFAWLPAFFTGGLTVAGKAATVASRLNASRNILSSVGKGVTTTQRIRSASSSLSSAAKFLDPANKTLVNTALQAGKAGDTATFVSNMRKVLKGPLSDDAAKALRVSLDDLGNMKDLAKLEGKLVKQGITRGSPQMEELLQEGFLKSSRVSQVEAGQRSFLRGKLPFTAGDGKTLITGKGIFKVLDNILGNKVATSAATAARLGDVIDESGDLLANLPAGTTSEALQTTLFLNNRTAEAAKKEIADAIAKWGSEIEEIAPGALAGGLDEVMPFFREGGGIPESILERAGLLDDVVAGGGKFSSSIIRAPKDAGKTSKILKLHRLRSGGKSAVRLAPGEAGIKILPQAELARYLDSRGWLKAAQELNGNLENTYKKLWTVMDENDIVNDITALASYINRNWEGVGGIVGSRKLAKELQKHGAFTNQRKFRSLIDGMNHNFVPKQQGALKLVQDYTNNVHKIVANTKTIKDLRNSSNRVWVDGHQVSMFASTKEIARLAKEGVDVDGLFVNLAEEGLESREMLKRMNLLGTPRKLKSGKTVIAGGRSWVPVQLARDLKVLHADPFSNAAAQAVDRFNALSKAASLSFSLFHAGALTESAVASMGVKGFVESGKRGFGIPFISQALKKMGVGKISDDVVDAYRQAGGVSEAASDVQRGLLTKSIEDIGTSVNKAIPGSKVVADHVGKFTETVNTALWDNLHDSLKLVGFQHWRSKLRKLNPTISQLDLDRWAVLKMNDTFGGQNWQQMLVNPKFKQLMHWALLAPDWTISNARIAGIGTTGLKGTLRGILGRGRNPGEQIVGSYWRHAIPMMYGTASLLNKSLTGRWLWENPPEHKFDVGLGTKDEKGREEFMKLGKQMREPFRWLSEPLKMFGGKMSPASKEIAEQLTGRSPGSQFPTEFAQGRGDLPLNIVEQIPKRAKNLFKKFVPFSLGGKSVFYAFPKASLTESQIVKGLIKAAEGGKLGAASPQEVRLILSIASQNGMNLNRIKARVRKEIGNPVGLFSGVRSR